MNPHIANHGRSFMSAAQYYLHDKNANTRERVAWAETLNTITNDAYKAPKVMAYTAMSQAQLKAEAGRSRAGAKTQKPVMAYSLSWHPDYDPSKDHMMQVAMSSMEALGVKDHEAIIVAHRDTPHRHLHVIVNRIHPQTGLVASDYNTKRKLSDFARIYCKDHNMSHLAPMREENHKKRQQGQNTKYRDPNIANAWANSDTGTSFAAALEDKGYKLAQGRKRIVVIDPYGKTHNPVRHLEGIKTKDFNARIKDMNANGLPCADELAKTMTAKHEAKKKAKVEKEGGELKAEFNRKANKEQPTNDNSNPSKDSAKQKHERSKRLSFSYEFSKLVRHQTYEENRKRYELRKHYNLTAQKQAIDELKHKAENAPWWRNLLGLTRRDRERLSDLQKTFTNAKTHYDEQINTLKSEFQQAQDELRKKHGIDEQEKQQRIGRISERAELNRNRGLARGR